MTMTELEQYKPAPHGPAKRYWPVASISVGTGVVTALEVVTLGQGGIVLSLCAGWVVVQESFRAWYRKGVRTNRWKVSEYNPIVQLQEDRKVLENYIKELNMQGSSWAVEVLAEIKVMEKIVADHAGTIQILSLELAQISKMSYNMSKAQLKRKDLILEELRWHYEIVSKICNEVKDIVLETESLIVQSRTEREEALVEVYEERLTKEKELANVDNISVNSLKKFKEHLNRISESYKDL